MKELARYAIIDGASEEGLLDFLSEHNPPHSCLYAEPLPQELAVIAPYLVLVTDEVSEWLADKVNPWGIYVFTSVTMKELRHHLRKYLQIIIPTEEKPVFFRFYDPRNIWDFCSVLSDWELHCFMGPISRVCTTFDGVLREDDYSIQRQQFPATSKSKVNTLKINQSQLDALDQIAEDKYIRKLTDSVESQFDKVFTSSHVENYEFQKLNLGMVVKWVYDFCKQNEINDDRSIRGLLYLFVKNGVYKKEGIPSEWMSNLLNKSLPGYYRAEVLLGEELGYIPV